MNSIVVFRGSKVSVLVDNVIATWILLGFRCDKINEYREEQDSYSAHLKDQFEDSEDVVKAEVDKKADLWVESRGKCYGSYLFVNRLE